MKRDFSDKSKAEAPRAARSSAVIVLLLVVGGFIAWSGALEASFALDDRMYIIKNPAIRSPGNFLDFLDTRYLTYLSFALNYRLGGLVAFDYHLVNVIIHIVNSMLVFMLVRDVFHTPALEVRTKRVASSERLPISFGALSAALFLLHPVHTQAVTYISQRSAELAVMFYLLAMFLYARAALGRGAALRRGAGWRRRLLYAGLYMGAVASAVLAMFSKEIAFTLPFAITLYDVIFLGGSSEGLRGRLKRLAPFYLTLLIIPFLLFAPELGFGSGAGLDEELRKLKLLEAAVIPRDVYLYTQFRVIVTYIRLMVFPANLHFVYDYPMLDSLAAPAPFLSLLFSLSLLGAAAVCLRASRGSPRPFGAVFSFGIFWFYIALSVESFMVPIKDVIFEHRLYLPSVGFIISACAVFFYCAGRLNVGPRRLRGPAIAALVCLVVLAPPMVSALRERNRVWSDEIKLLTDEIKKSPEKASVYYLRGLAHLDSGAYAEAIADNTVAAAMNPGYKEAFHHRAIAYSALMRYDDALGDFAIAIALDPAYIKAYINRALTRAAMGELAEALSDISHALAIRPDYTRYLVTNPLVQGAMGELRAECAAKEINGCEEFMALFE